MGPDYRSCPFNGRPCTAKCAVFVEPKDGADTGRCGLIHTKPDGSFGGGSEKVDGNNKERAPKFSMCGKT